MRTRTRWALLALLASGCAENAILELDLVAPAGADGARAIAVQIESTEDDFDPADATMQLGGQVVIIPLDGTVPTQLTIEAGSTDAIERPVWLGMWLCDRPDCDVVPPAEPYRPTVAYHLERAFFLGEYTHLDLDVSGAFDPDATPVAEEVSKCRLRACGVADTSFCYTDDDGEERHFCEH